MTEMFKVMREDGIFSSVRCIGQYDTKEEAQLVADRATASDRVGNYYYWVEKEGKTND